MVDVQCFGNESRLDECLFNKSGMSEQSCKEAGVSCGKYTWQCPITC